jgi:DNA helicase-2/ATP-dependent DNA helicase PcrA
VAACYAEYQKRLLASNAADFDDLLVKVLELFSRDAEVAARYGRRCRYLLVDEYQDTNHVQYRLIQALAATHGNVCVVGDPDQSIYRFRGADIRNILAFERDFPEARTVKLEQNYRSCQRILAAADGVIAQNRERHEKTLWTENEEGALLSYLPAPDDRAEAEWVVDRIEALEREGLSDEELAVLYRTNAQSRVFEDRLSARGRPYRVVGSLRFYERKEIKDLLAYLRLCLDPDDELAWVRAAGTPPRGIGARTLESLRGLAQERSCSLGAAAEAALREGLLAERALRALRDFLDLLRDLRETAATVGSAALVGTIVKVIDYGAYLERTHPEDAASRMENVDALMSAAEEYDEEGNGEGLTGFVDRSSLRSETDEVSGERGVTLMTIHAAKGLEFDGVFLVGLEENIFPHVRSLAHESDLEEERRLCYVAMTRARHRLFLSSCAARRQFGDFVSNEPSRFLAEVPAELLASPEEREVPRPGYRHLREGGVWGRPARPGRAAASPARPRPVPGERRVVADADSSDVSADDLRPGTWVRHPMFGEGRVLSREGEGQNLKLTIRFTDHGTKKILPRYTTLVPA